MQYTHAPPQISAPLARQVWLRTAAGSEAILSNLTRKVDVLLVWVTTAADRVRQYARLLGGPGRLQGIYTQRAIPLTWSHANDYCSELLPVNFPRA